MSNYGSTYSMLTVAQAVQAQLVAAHTTLGIDSNDIYYGDQVLVPRSPIICVEPSSVHRSLSGASRPPRTDNKFSVHLLCYIQEVSDSSTIAIHTDQFIDKVCDVINKDTTLGNTVLFAFTSDIEPGYAARGRALYRVARITIDAQTKTFLVA